MAQTSKPQTATPGVFELDADHLNAYKTGPSRGRAASPSPYLDAIREAIKTGTPKGIAVQGKNEEEQVKHARRINNDLRKGIKQLASEYPDKLVRISAAVRMNHPKLPPFVAFEARLEDKPATTE